MKNGKPVTGCSNIQEILKKDEENFKNLIRNAC